MENSIAKKCKCQLKESLGKCFDLRYSILKEKKMWFKYMLLKLVIESEQSGNVFWCFVLHMLVKYLSFLKLLCHSFPHQFPPKTFLSCIRISQHRNNFFFLTERKTEKDKLLVTRMSYSSTKSTLLTTLWHNMYAQDHSARLGTTRYRMWNQREMSLYFIANLFSLSAVAQWDIVTQPRLHRNI